MLPVWVRLYRLIFGAIGLIAVFNNYTTFDDLHFRHFFTNQSNIAAGVILLLGAAVFAKRENPLWWDIVRGSAVIAMLVTGLVYGLLVERFYNPFSGEYLWSSSVLHQLMPVVILLDFLIVPLSRRIPWWSVVFFVTFPLVYLAWSLNNGANDGWYPYDFVDPATYGNGMTGVMTTSAALLAAFIAIGALLITYSRSIRKSLAG